MDTDRARVSPWGRRLAWGGGLLWLVTAAALLGFLAARMLPGRQPAPDAQVIVNEVRKVAKLATVEVRESEILKVGGGTPLFVFFESRKDAVLLVKGRILAGVDLEKASFEVSDDAYGHRLLVHLPEAEILAVEDDIQFYSESSGFFTPIEPHDRNQWMMLARASLRRAALRNGIRERATEHAQALIGGLASGLGYRVSYAGAVESAVSATESDGRDAAVPPSVPTGNAR